MNVTNKNLRTLIREAVDAYAKTHHSDLRGAPTVKVDKPDQTAPASVPNMRSDSPVQQKTKLVAKELQAMGKPIKSNDLLAFMQGFDNDDIVIRGAKWFAKKFAERD